MLEGKSQDVVLQQALCLIHVSALPQRKHPEHLLLYVHKEYLLVQNLPRICGDKRVSQLKPESKCSNSYCPLRFPESSLSGTHVV